MSKKRDRAEFDAVLAQYGQSFELNESTGKATVTLSDEGEILLGKAAAKKGIDLPTYLTRVCEHLMDRILDERDAHEAEAEFLPWSREEYERRIGDGPAQDEVFIDLSQTTPTLALMQTANGRRDYYFPPLPQGLTKEQRFNLCQGWANDELVSRGMACEFELFRSENGIEPCFSCPIFEMTPAGLGDEIEEWGTIEFFDHLKQSFAKTVNDALEKKGLPRSYEIL
jgi:hypothetical protein